MFPSAGLSLIDLIIFGSNRDLNQPTTHCGKNALLRHYNLTTPSPSTTPSALMLSMGERRNTGLAQLTQNIIIHCTARVVSSLVASVSSTAAMWCQNSCTTRLVARNSTPAALGPGVDSASNRKEYQKQENNVSGE
jgi:hypothetical protein